MRRKPEEIVQKLRQGDVLVGQGMQHVDAIRKVRHTLSTSEANGKAFVSIQQETQPPQG